MTDTENNANTDAAETTRPEPGNEKPAATGRVVLVPVPSMEVLSYAADLEILCLILLGAVGGLVLAHVVTVLFRR